MKKILLTSTALVLSVAAYAASPEWTGPVKFDNGYSPDLALFGTGADGSVTCSGASTLTRDMNYANLTVQSGCVINTGGYRIFVNGTLNLSTAPAGAIISNGGTPAASSGATPRGGAFGNQGFTVPGPLQNGTGIGGVGATGVGAAGATNGGNANSPLFGGTGGIGGVGGASTNAGGAAGVVAADDTVVPQLSAPIINLNLAFQTSYFLNGVIPHTATCGTGGGAGGGDGINLSGAGGTAGVAPTAVEIFANMIQRGSNATAGIIQSKGGGGSGGGTASGTGNSAGGAGAGGCGGGFVYIVATSLLGTPITGAIDVSGGTGGTGGNGNGTGHGGNGGTGGGCGGVQEVILVPGTFVSSTTNAAGTVGAAGAVPAGGLGGPPCVSQVSL